MYNNSTPRSINNNIQLVFHNPSHLEPTSTQRNNLNIYITSLQTYQTLSRPL